MNIIMDVRYRFLQLFSLVSEYCAWYGLNVVFRFLQLNSNGWQLVLKVFKVWIPICFFKISKPKCCLWIWGVEDFFFCKSFPLSDSYFKIILYLLTTLSIYLLSFSIHKIILVQVCTEILINFFASFLVFF